MNRRFVLVSTAVLFIVLFNIGFVFHEPLMGAWFHHQEASIVRENFIIPFIALAYLVYYFLLSYFFPIFVAYYPGASRVRLALKFGFIMGVLFDALQGGIIEVATFNMPISVFFVDSGYHVFFEGSIAGLILAFVSQKWPTQQV